MPKNKTFGMICAKKIVGLGIGRKSGFYCPEDEVFLGIWDTFFLYLPKLSMEKGIFKEIWTDLGRED